MEGGAVILSAIKYFPQTIRDQELQVVLKQNFLLRCRNFSVDILDIQHFISYLLNSDAYTDTHGSAAVTPTRQLK